MNHNIKNDIYQKYIDTYEDMSANINFTIKPLIMDIVSITLPMIIILLLGYLIISRNICINKIGSMEKRANDYKNLPALLGHIKYKLKVSYISIINIKTNREIVKLGNKEATDLIYKIQLTEDHWLYITKHEYSQNQIESMDEVVKLGKILK